MHDWDVAIVKNLLLFFKEGLVTCLCPKLINEQGNYYYYY